MATILHDEVFAGGAGYEIEDTAPLGAVVTVYGRRGPGGERPVLDCHEVDDVAEGMRAGRALLAAHLPDLPGKRVGG